MRWSLITLFALAAVTLPLYPGIDGGRVARDDSKEDGDVGWIQNLLNSLMGGNNSDESKDGTETTTTTTTPLPTGEVELLGVDDMELVGNTTVVGNTSSTTSKIPISTPYDESEGLLKDGSSSIDTVTTPVTTPSSTPTSTSTTKNQECDNDMTKYCDLSGSFKEYMQENFTIASLTHKLFSRTVVDQLLTMCKAGEWCLTDGDKYIQAFSDSMHDFFRGPLCTQGLLECVELMLVMRKGCPDELWLSTFEDALSSLVCEMNAVPGLTPECFGHTLATLHVTLADEIRQASKKLNLGNEFCLGSYVGMTRKFMCTLEKCPHHQELFENFQPWQWFMDDSSTIKQICKLDTVCGDKELQVEKSESSTPYLTTTPQTSTQTENPTDHSEHNEPPDHNEPRDHNESPDHNETPGRQDHHRQNQDKPYFIIQASDESTRLLIGIATGTIVAVLGVMVLICAVLKRMRRRGKGLMKEGYSKLPTDDMN